jgi:hypothetical protein
VRSRALAATEGRSLLPAGDAEAARLWRALARAGLVIPWPVFDLMELWQIGAIAELDEVGGTLDDPAVQRMLEQMQTARRPEGRRRDN